MKPYVLASIFASFATMTYAQDAASQLSPETLALVENIGIAVEELNMQPVLSPKCADEGQAYNVRILTDKGEDAYFNRPLNDILVIVDDAYSQFPSVISRTVGEKESPAFIVEKGIYFMVENDEPLSPPLITRPQFDELVPLSAKFILKSRLPMETVNNADDFTVGKAAQPSCQIMNFL